jgi:hypothetical protein
MNEPLALDTEHLSPYRPCWRIMEGHSFTRDFEGFCFDIYISGFLFLDPEDVVHLSGGTEGETSVHILCECEALASLRHTYLDSFFLDPEDVINLSMGAIWNFVKGTGLL